MSYRRRKRAPPICPPQNTLRTFKTGLPKRDNVLQRIRSDPIAKKEEQERYLLEWRNNPQPHYAKCITTNARFYNEPIIYMVTEGTEDKQHQWWPGSEPIPVCSRPKPSYDKQSTQRSDFQKPDCKLCRPVRYSSIQQPSRGIVPLASPQTPDSLPRIFQEQLSFKYQYNARTTPCVPYQGKRIGAFVLTEITPKGETSSEGTKTLLSSEELGSLGESKSEKGPPVESCTTSPNLPVSDSQKTVDSSAHLSKTDIGEGAKIEPRPSEKGEESAGNVQTNVGELSPPCAEASSKPSRKGSLDKLQTPLPPIPPAEPSVKIQAA